MIFDWNLRSRKHRTNADLIGAISPKKPFSSIMRYIVLWRHLWRYRTNANVKIWYPQKPDILTFTLIPSSFFSDHCVKLYRWMCITFQMPLVCIKYIYVKANIHLVWAGVYLHGGVYLHMCKLTFTYMQLRSHAQKYTRVQIIHICIIYIPCVNQRMWTGLKSHNSGIKYVIHQFLEKECRGWTSFFLKSYYLFHDTIINTILIRARDIKFDSIKWRVDWVAVA